MRITNRLPPLGGGCVTDVPAACGAVRCVCPPAILSGVSFTFESWGQSGPLSRLDHEYLERLFGHASLLPCSKMGWAVNPRAPLSFSLLSYSSLCRAPSPEWPSLKNFSSDPATSGTATSADSHRMGLTPWELSVGAWLVWELSE